MSNKPSISKRGIAPKVTLIKTEPEKKESTEKPNLTKNKKIKNKKEYIFLNLSKYPNKVKRNFTYDCFVDQAIIEIKNSIPEIKSISSIVEIALKEYLFNDPEVQRLAVENKTLDNIIKKINTHNK